MVLGGNGNDTINGGVGRDIVLGDNGNATFDDAGVLIQIQTSDAAVAGSYDDIINGYGGDNVILGGNGDDQITTLNGEDMILGDNGQATFSSAGIRLNIHTTDPGYGGVDTIHAGNGPKLIMGGDAGDFIFAGASDTSPDIMLGDSGNATFTKTGLFQSVQNTGNATFTNAGVVYQVQISDAGHGGDDVIVATGNGAAIMMGGSGHDLILAATGNAAKDVVIADYGIVQFDHNGKLIEIFSTDPGAGGNAMLYGDVVTETVNFNSNQQAGLLRLSGIFDHPANTLSNLDFYFASSTVQTNDWLAQPGKTYLAGMPWRQIHEGAGFVLQMAGMQGGVMPVGIGTFGSDFNVSSLAEMPTLRMHLSIYGALRISAD